MKKWLLGTLLAAILLSGAVVYFLYDALGVDVFGGKEDTAEVTYSLMTEDTERDGNTYSLRTQTAEDGSQTRELVYKEPQSDGDKVVASGLTSCILGKNNLYYQRGLELHAAKLDGTDDKLLATLPEGSEMISLTSGWMYIVVNRVKLVRVAADGSGAQNDVTDLSLSGQVFATPANAEGFTFAISGDWVEIGNYKNGGFRIHADGSGERKPL